MKHKYRYSMIVAATVLALSGTAFAQPYYGGAKVTITNGTFNGSFGSGGKSTHNFGGSSSEMATDVLLSNGKLIVAGRAILPSGEGRVIVARMNKTTGALDSTFGSNGFVFGQRNALHVQAMALDAEGRIYVTGTTQGPFESVPFVERFTAGGATDTSTFAGFNVADTCVGNAIHIDQSTGKITIVGGCTSGEGLNAYFIAARFKSNLTLDNTFNPTYIIPGTKPYYLGVASVTSAAATGVTADATGKLVLGGSFTASGDRSFAALRITADGSPDATYGNAGVAIVNFAGTDATAYGIAKYSNMVVLAGTTAPGSGSKRATLVRLRTDGSLDPSFTDGISGAGIVRFNSSEDDIFYDVKISNTIIIGIGRAGADSLAVRYLSDGTLNTFFDGDGYLTYDHGFASDRAYTGLIDGSDLYLYGAVIN